MKPPRPELEETERRLKRLFVELIYKPLIAGEKFQARIVNASPDYQGLYLALSSGKVTFNRGVFSGKFDAASTLDLKKLGAEWDAASKTFHFPTDKLPQKIQTAVRLSESRFNRKIEGLEAKLDKILASKPWEKFQFADVFDKAIFRMDKDFRVNVQKISIQPEVSAFEARKISEEWQDNLQIKIKDFTEEQILELRQRVRACYFSGNRYGSLIGVIRDSYGVSDRKAEFLARQETNLLTAAYQGNKYVEAGFPHYLWRAVAGTAEHPTRKRHQELSRMSDRGITFAWADPPWTTEEGEPKRYNNPGQDYNCRCTAIPVAAVKK